jgi:hypothetical protein
MKNYFNYLFCLLFIFQISIAQEKKETKKETPASNDRIKSNIGSNKTEADETLRKKPTEAKTDSKSEKNKKRSE